MKLYTAFAFLSIILCSPATKAQEICKGSNGTVACDADDSDNPSSASSLIKSLSRPPTQNAWMNSAKCLNVEGRRRYVQPHDTTSCPIVNSRFKVTYKEYGGRENYWSDLLISTNEANGIKNYAVSVPDWNSDRSRSYAYFYKDLTYISDNQPHEIYPVNSYGFSHMYQVFCAKNVLTIVEYNKYQNGKQQIKIQYSLEFSPEEVVIAKHSTCRDDGMSGSDGSLIHK